jgi:magnesium-transporting ATPase (P-type)
MIGDPKEKKEFLDKLILSVGKEEKPSRFSEFISILNFENIFQLTGIALLMVLGLGVVTASVLGAIQPLWVSTVFSILGSAATMVGLYLAYQLFTRNNIFDSLINKAIRRVIQSQN